MSASFAIPPFVQPVGGKTIVWQPLKTKDELQILAVYRSEQNRHLQIYARLAARIVSIDGNKKDGGYSPNDFGDWDNFDTEAFLDEVNLREAERIAALSKKAPDDVRAALDAAGDEAMVALARLQGAIVAVRQLARSTPNPQ